MSNMLRSGWQERKVLCILWVVGLNFFCQETLIKEYEKNWPWRILFCQSLWKIIRWLQMLLLLYLMKIQNGRPIAAYCFGLIHNIRRIFWQPFLTPLMAAMWLWLYQQAQAIAFPSCWHLFFPPGRFFKLVLYMEVISFNWKK